MGWRGSAGDRRDARLSAVGEAAIGNVSLLADGYQHHALRYRPDIDGLRAIAVGAVILFHVAPNKVRAGGLGVDLFFVISGYLIGGIVLAAIAEGRFSFTDFYVRRIRRIVPALVVMIAATTLLAFWPLYPLELERLAQSALAAIGCASNVYFYATADYFAADSATLPLLHTWSLGVEEQFYLIFPLLPLLAAGVAGGRLVTPLLLATAVTSLAVSQYQVIVAPTAAFYLLPSRWWELMLGVLATRVPNGWMRASALRMGMAVAGLALMSASFVLVVPARGFPGLAALPLCLGVVLVLVSGQFGASPVHRVLGAAPLRITGLASYSLYLWHWPVIVLYRMDHLIGRLGMRDLAMVLAATAVLGFGSWRFVEQPFRRTSLGVRRLLVSAGAMTAIAALVPVAIVMGHGFPERIPPAALALAQFANAPKPFPMPAYKCVLANEDPFRAFDSAHCLGRVAGRPNWLLVGDSHAAMLWSGLVREVPEVHVQVAAQLGCEIPLDPQPGWRACDQLMRHALIDHLMTDPPDLVLLTWRWQHVDERGLETLATWLRRRNVPLIVMGPSAGYTVPVARVLAEALRRGDPALIGKALEPRLAGDDARLAVVTKRISVPYLSPLRAMCPSPQRCVVTGAAGRPLYRDGDHYTVEGSAMLIARLRNERSPAGDAFRQAIAGR